MAKRKARTCHTCGSELVECDAKGASCSGGGYLVCPRALEEHAPDAFLGPHEQRRHRDARVVESAAHARARRRAQREAQLTLESQGE